MINRTTLMAGVAAVVMAAGTTAAFAQVPQDAGTTMYPGQHHGVHHATAGIKGARPLTVKPMTPPPPPPAPMAGLGDALAAPFNAVGAVGGPIIGTGAGIAGSTVAGAASIATAPISGLMGTAPGISTMAAPPLPIKARYANSGAVTATFDEGFSQDVPVDRSGPIYQIDNTGHDRTVTPFSLVVFPVTAATYAITSPLRPVAPHP